MTQTVSPARIESELERIWTSLQGKNKMRACLFNLLIYSKKSHRTAYLSQVAQQVIEKFPSRILFITYDDTTSNKVLKTAVSVLRAHSGGHEIICDMIEIEVYQKDHAKVPFIILPHILPDLPVYFVYADDPTLENPIAQKLKQLSNRIIFDSETSSDLKAFAECVLKRHFASNIDIADLNWARTEGWRLLFANVFKSSEDLNLLKQSQEIHLTFNAKKSDFVCHTQIQSIYLQAWLASQLNWRFLKTWQENNRLIFSYQTDSMPVTITLHPQDMSLLPSGRILSIQIKTQSQECYELKRNPQHLNHIIIEKSSPTLCDIPTHFVFEKDSIGQSLVKEICHQGTSKHYINMLNMIQKIEGGAFCL